MNRDYLLDKITKAQSAIAFASPGADLSYAKAILSAAQAKLAKLDKANA